MIFILFTRLLDSMHYHKLLLTVAKINFLPDVGLALHCILAHRVLILSTLPPSIDRNYAPSKQQCKLQWVWFSHWALLSLNIS